MKHNNLPQYSSSRFYSYLLNDEKIWLQGYESALREEEVTKNPYKRETRQHYYWQEGWWTAFYEDVPWFVIEKKEHDNNYEEIEKSEQYSLSIPDEVLIHQQNISKNYIPINQNF